MKFIPHVRLQLNTLNIQKILLRLIFSLLMTTSALLLDFAFYPVLKISPFVLFVPAIAISSVYGWFWGGSAATIFSAACLYYFFARIPHINFWQTIFQIAIFIMIGFLLSVIIDWSRRSNKINVYKDREKNYLFHIKNLEADIARVKQEITARDEFLSIASHELKTPLTSMLLQLQTILHNIKNVSLANFSVENLLKLLENAENQTRRLHKMINDLLDVSLITTGKMDLELEDADLSQVARDVAESFSKKLEKDGVILRQDINNEVRGKFDKLRAAQVITNLLSNSIKYGNGKPISLKVEKDGTIGRIKIVDQGVGIESEDLKRIFARFERAGNHNGIKGLGVGLYITHQIVAAHHGKISVKSKPAHGSEFVVEIPLG